MAESLQPLVHEEPVQRSAQNLPRSLPAEITVHLRDLPSSTSRTRSSSASSDQCTSAYTAELNQLCGVLPTLTPLLQILGERFNVLQTNYDDRDRAWGERLERLADRHADHMDALTDRVEDLATQFAELRANFDDHRAKSNERRNSSETREEGILSARVDNLEHTLADMGSDLKDFKTKMFTDLKQTQQSLSGAHATVELARRDFQLRTQQLAEKLTALELSALDTAESSPTWPLSPAPRLSPLRLIDPVTNNPILLPISPPNPSTFIKPKPSHLTSDTPAFPPNPSTSTPKSKPTLVDPSTNSPIILPATSPSMNVSKQPFVDQKACIHFNPAVPGSCRNGNDCPFVHDMKKRPTLCHHHFDPNKPGSCRRGNRCHFAHSIDEMRAAMNWEVEE